MEKPYVGGIQTRLGFALVFWWSFAFACFRLLLRRLHQGEIINYHDASYPRTQQG